MAMVEIDVLELCFELFWRFWISFRSCSQIHLDRRLTQKPWRRWIFTVNCERKQTKPHSISKAKSRLFSSGLESCTQSKQGDWQRRKKIPRVCLEPRFNFLWIISFLIKCCHGKFEAKRYSRLKSMETLKHVLHTEWKWSWLVLNNHFYCSLMKLYERWIQSCKTMETKFESSVQRFYGIVIL